MGFSTNQLRALRRDVDRRNLRTRQVENGRVLTYIEGWQAIAEANRIFGFDGWDRETIETRCVLAREVRGTFTAIYIARVRIKVRAEGETVIREGHGTGEAQGAHPGEAHDKAIKVAETDATKRALATFGKPFGLSLYLNGRARRDQQPPQSPEDYNTRPHPVTAAPDLERRRTLQRRGPNGRYYVPRRTEPTSDAFHAVLAKEHADQGKERGLDGGNGIEDGASATDEPPAAPPSTDTPGPEAKDRESIRASLAEETAFLIAHPRRIRDKDHLRFVVTQPCLLCGRTPSDAHHLRFAQPRAMSRKVSDEFTVPLCRTHHRQLHHAGDEAAWWEDIGIDPLPIAQDLWTQTRRRSKGTITQTGVSDKEGPGPGQP